MTLASGLDDLAGLRKLTELDVSFIDHRIGVTRIGKDKRLLAKAAQNRWTVQEPSRSDAKSANGLPSTVWTGSSNYDD